MGVHILAFPQAKAGDMVKQKKKHQNRKILMLS